MPSKSNIGSDEIYRYLADETGDIVLEIWKDGSPADITNRSFAFEFIGRNTGSSTTLDRALLKTNEQLTRYPGKTGRLGCWLSAADREQLPNSTYRLWIHETTSGRRKALWAYTFNWKLEPDNYDAQQPLDPAILVLNLTSDPERVSPTVINEGPRGQDALMPIATISQLPALAAGQPLIAFIPSEGRAILKAGPDLYFEILLSPITVTS